MYHKSCRNHRGIRVGSAASCDALQALNLPASSCGQMSHGDVLVLQDPGQEMDVLTRWYTMFYATNLVSEMKVNIAQIHVGSLEANSQSACKQHRHHKSSRRTSCDALVIAHPFLGEFSVQAPTRRKLLRLQCPEGWSLCPLARMGGVSTPGGINYPCQERNPSYRTQFQHDNKVHNQTEMGMGQN